MMQSTPHLAKAIKEAHDLFKELTPIDKWHLSSDKNDVKVYVRQDSSTGLNMARGESIILKPVSQILPALRDVNQILAWDDGLETNEILEKVEDFEIVRTLGAKKPLVTQRETVAVTKVFHLEQNSVLIVGKSIEHPAFPPRTAYVTAQVHIWGWLLTPVKDDVNKTHALYIMFVDPKGWVPTTIFNAVVHEQAQNARKLKNFVEKN